MNVASAIEATILVIIFLCCIIGNSMMCLVIFRDKLTRSRTYTLLGNLAIADLGMGLCCIPFTIITLFAGDWVIGETLCQVNGFMNSFWIPATVFSTTCISVHKYLSMHDPFNPSRTWKRVQIFILITWILSLTCALGPLLGWNEFGYSPGSSQCGLASSSSSTDLSYMIFLAIFVYSVPMVLNVFSFIKVFASVRKHSGRLARTAIQTPTGVQKRTAVTFLMVFVSYVVSWTPFFAYAVFKLVNEERNISGQYVTAAYLIGFSNTVHNPVIFAFRNRNFRNSFKEIFQAMLLRHRRKFRTITNTSNFSFYIFKRHSTDFSSTWYLDREDTLANEVFYTREHQDILIPLDDNGVYRETTAL